MTTDDAAAPPAYVLEPATPLADSLVWRLQRTFYGDQGIAAWNRSRVPQSVTTSPSIAYAYARIVLGFLRDCAPTLDSTQPVYIVELGAGSGRLAYRFLKAFTQLQHETTTPRQPFVYVMTDASPTVVEFWRDHPRLQPFIDAGVLDAAHFDLMQLAALQLIHSGVTLRPGELANPVVLIGNYIFDSIPQDALTLRDGEFFRNLVTINASSPTLDLTAEQSRVRIAFNFTTDPTPFDVAAEPDPLLQTLLREYQSQLRETTVLLPRAGLACVRYFAELGGGRALNLIGDLGDTHIDELDAHGPPGFGAGGGFWLPVNFHALGEYTRGLGGRVRHPRNRHLNLNISMLLFGPPDLAFGESELAFTDTVDRHSPDDLAMVARTIGDQLPTLKLEAILALLHATAWDPDYVRRTVPALLPLLADAPARHQRDLERGVQLAWEQYYPMDEPDDVPFALGVLLYAVGRYSEALEFFERSLEEHGLDPRTTVNLAMTCYRLERRAEALRWLDRTLELDPTHELAQSMRPDVEAELAAE